MKTKKDIAKLKKANKHSALLALALSEKEPVGDCLTTKEMAQLVDHGFPSQTRKKYQEHLDSCETCYQEWLTLSRLKKTTHSKREKIHRLFSTPKNLAIAGSSLAVAASVLLFLNIDHDLRQQGKLLPGTMSTQELPTSEKPSPAMVNEAKPTPAQPEQPPMETASPWQHFEAEENRDLSEQLESQATERITSPATKASQSKATEKQAPKKRRLLAPAPPSSFTDNELPVKRKELADDNKSLLQSREKLENMQPAWFSTLREACQQSEFSESFWKEKHREGKLFLQRLQKDSDATPKHIRLLSRMVVLTGSLTTENGTEQCSKILPLLEEELRNR